MEVGNSQGKVGARQNLRDLNSERSGGNLAPGNGGVGIGN